MCGIAGVVSLEKKFINVDISKSMVDILEHRGPDDSGYLFFHTGARHNPNISFYLNLTDEEFKHVNQTLNTIKASEVQKELHEHDYDLFLGFRRLAILDLSSAGHQPFSDLSKNIWLVFNGEIYNYVDLRSELRNFGHRFKSNCDTEVIVYSFVQWGIECVKKFNGMFSFALYDNFKKKLYLVRDRCGIKPMYWSIDEDYNFTFASEV
ncbi:MAG: asparagine synthetase B, partial [Candidatus Calescibacterium sp.]|nr:asparagine synthetase B [Candidatus Calescibacterium sp.]